MTVARFNLTHGSRAEHEPVMKRLQAALVSQSRVCATLVSLRGGAVRTGCEPATPRRVAPGDVQVWHCVPVDAPAEADAVARQPGHGVLRCREMAAVLCEGDTLLVEDGQLAFSVLHADAATGRIIR